MASLNATIRQNRRSSRNCAGPRTVKQTSSLPLAVPSKQVASLNSRKSLSCCISLLSQVHTLQSRTVLTNVDSWLFMSRFLVHSTETNQLLLQSCCKFEVTVKDSLHYHHVHITNTTPLLTERQGLLQAEEESGGRAKTTSRD